MFTGGYNLPAGRASFFTGVAVEPTRLVKIEPGRLREITAQDETLSELILHALLRIQALQVPGVRRHLGDNRSARLGVTGPASPR